MVNPKEAKSPSTPTARKAPSTPQSSAATARKPAQGNRQRKGSGSATPQSAPQRKLSSGSQGSVQTNNKRKVDMEDTSTATIPAEGDSEASFTTPFAIPTPKRQKIDAESPSYITTFQEETRPLMPSQQPIPRPVQTRQIQKISNIGSLDTGHQLLVRALQMKPSLIPRDPLTMAITSNHINEIAHTIWQIAFSHGRLLQEACQSCAMFPHTTLQVLANLNYLPSWWFFRDMAVKVMRIQSWAVDDRVMQREWSQMTAWCRKFLPLPVLIQSDHNEVTKEKGINDPHASNEEINHLGNP